jgi:hypothetical protein
MTVSELISILGELDPNAQVLIMSQFHWPFEYSVSGVALRSEMEETDEEDEHDAPSEDVPRSGPSPTDVFIVEGQQLRYGSKIAWDVARQS